MKKMLVVVLSVVFLVSGLFLVSCKKQEPAVEKETVTEPVEKEAPEVAPEEGAKEEAETGGY